MPEVGADNGTRTRWNGVISGGPLGGVDLSSATGQFNGDLAVADDTSSATAGAWARWDASASNWQYADPTDGVTGKFISSEFKRSLWSFPVFRALQ